MTSNGPTHRESQADLAVGATALHQIPEGATIRRRYWAVPQPYASGPEFGTQAEAITAGLTHRRFMIDRGGPDGLVPERFSVDLRWAIDYPAGGGIDTVVARTTYDTLAEAREHLDRIGRYNASAH